MSQFKTAHYQRDTLRSHVQHHLNPLHLYCRLRDWGVPRRKASQFCSCYERVYRVFFQRRSPAGN